MLLFDSNAQVGRKLLVTGSGRCNISNRFASPQDYACAETAFVERVFSHYDSSKLLDYLRELGIPTHSTTDGWCYPLSDSAQTVVETLRAELEAQGVDTHLQTKISDIGRVRGGFSLVVGPAAHAHRVDRLIIASGGKAHPVLGSKGDLFPVLASLGHRTVPIRPALVSIEADVRRLQKLQGVRLDATLTLRERGRSLGVSTGNVLFTQYGLSGPAAMNLSYLVSARAGVGLELEIDLLGSKRGALLEWLAADRAQVLPLCVVLGACLPPKIPPVILGLLGMGRDVRLEDLSASDLQHALKLLGHLVVQVKGARGFDQAQVSTGGVSVTEVEPDTMASRRVPGLYLAGEVLDVVGPCGGYNLQFALSSGLIAGASAGAFSRDDEHGRIHS